MIHEAFAIFCYLLALVGTIALVALVVLLGLDEFSREPLPPPWPWLINLGWLLLFALQHSGMARTGFKKRWARIVSPSVERSIYAGISGLLLLGLSLTWQLLPGEPLWCLPIWVLGIALAAGLGIGLYLLTFDHLGFFGLRKEKETLRLVGPYRFLRHPLMACQILFLWAQPVMSPALALLSGGLTLYIVLAIPLEEGELRRRFGSAYEDYRRRVPALIPWRMPIPPAIHQPQNP
jgi:protein-S-isoprenylcysteine O-methyltransferase Ste14